MKQFFHKSAYIKIYAYQDGNCYWCGIHCEPRCMNKSRIHPISSGGRGIQNNVLSCTDCNKIRANLSIREFRVAIERIKHKYLQRPNVSKNAVLEYGQQQKVNRYDKMIDQCDFLINGGNIRPGFHEKTTYLYVDIDNLPIKATKN